VQWDMNRSSMNNIQAEPNSIENDEAGVTLASYNLTLGKWVCPKPDDPQEAQQTLPLPIDIVPNGMFSLDEARLLDLRANETNFNSVVQILTGIPLDTNQQNDIVDFEEGEDEKPTLMGFGSNRRVNVRRRIPTDSRSTMPTMPGVEQGQMASRISRVRPNSSLTGALIDEEADVPYAETAICKPELTTVPLNQSSDPNIFILPNCVRIERCGGCCHHDLLECQPTHVEMKRMKVIQTTYQSSRRDVVGEMIVEVEKHTSCACGCKIKADHCNVKQYYQPSLCRCECMDKNEESLCKTRPYDRFWDPDQCQCRCKNEINCSTGMTFNSESCSCF